MESSSNRNLYYGGIIWVIPPIKVIAKETGKEFMVSGTSVIPNSHPIHNAVAHIVHLHDSDIFVMDVIESGIDYESGQGQLDLIGVIEDTMNCIDNPFVMMLYTKAAGATPIIKLGGMIKDLLRLPICLVDVDQPDAFYQEHSAIFKHVIGRGSYQYHLESLIRHGFAGPRESVEAIISCMT